MATAQAASTVRLSNRELGRALLARQGLLEPLALPLVEAVERIGAVQSQYWPAPPAALHSRMAEVSVADVHGALAAGDLVNGILLRGTLHVVSAREHPAYSAVAELSGTNTWRRVAKQPQPAMDPLRLELQDFARTQPRTPVQFAEYIEHWLAARPDALDPAEAEWQRSVNWRPFVRSSCFLRVPADGRWDTAKGPAESTAATRTPIDPDGVPADEALAEVVTRHLRAFGPAGADDVAYWTGCRAPQVRPVLESLAADGRAVTLADETGRVLYDLPEAPRPRADTPAPVRLLPWFDSALLAYDSKRRQRILPDEYKDAVYLKKNLQVLPTFLIDGLVAGIWAFEAKTTRGGSSCVVLKPFAKLRAADRKALTVEAERMARFMRPDAAAHSVRVED